MNEFLSDHICGMAAYLGNDTVAEKYPVFNLNGRKYKRIDRYLMKAKLKSGDNKKQIQSELKTFICQCDTEAILVHYATVADCHWEVLKKFSMPLYIYVHGFDIIWDHNDNSGRRLHDKEYVERIQKIGSAANVCFIVSSDCSRQNLVSIGIAPDKIAKKIFGVAVPTVERDYGKETVTVLFLGRFVDFKGPDIVLQAFLNACASGFKGRLIMAGDGPLRMMCELMSRRSEYSHLIEFTGVVDEAKAASLFAEADIYTMHNTKGLLSNGYDTFGVSIIEAMSYGLPVITAGIGGPSEIIQNGTDGILLEADNIQQHTSALMALFQQKTLRSTLGMNARRKIQHQFSAAKEKAELFQILNITGYPIESCVEF